MKLLRTAVLIAAIVLVFANPDCQRLNTGRCVHSEKHACKAERDCDWSHHNYCYLKCGNKFDDLKPILYFKFDDNFVDSSGNNFLITPGAGVHFTAGHRGGAATFDASDISIREAGTIGTPMKLRVKQEMSLAVWLYGHPDSRNFGLAGCWCGGGGYQFYDAYGGKKLVYILNPYVQHWPNPILGSNGWWHLTVTVAAQVITYYVNGAVVQTINIAPHGDIQYTNNAGCPWMVGRTSGGWNEFYYGAMDDFMFFDRALTQDEVNTIITYQNQGKQLEPVAVVEQPMAKVKPAQDEEDYARTSLGALPQQPMAKVKPAQDEEERTSLTPP